MSLTGSLRGVTGAVGRHAAVTQQAQLPAIAYMRRSFAVAQLRQQHQQIRSATSSANVPTTTLSQKEAMDLLNKQRSMRPNSPHLTIYQPQLTWYGSIANRITGVGLSGRAYCSQGQLGRHVLTSALLSLSSALCMGDLLPGPALYAHWRSALVGAYGPLCCPGSLLAQADYQGASGRGGELPHLERIQALGMGLGLLYVSLSRARMRACSLLSFPSGLSMKGVYASGYTVIGLSVLSTVGLCLL